MSRTRISRNFGRFALSATLLGAAFVGSSGSALAADNSAVPTPPIGTILSQRQSNSSSDDFSVASRQRLPWFVTLGAYFPNFSDGLSTDTGTEFAFGYSFVNDPVDVRVSARGQSFNVSDGGSATVSISMLTVEALFNFQQFYVGPGVSLGSAQISNGFEQVDTSTETIWSVAAGYNFTRRWFVEGRWQTAGEDGYKGYSVSVGYRF